jgi:hypothetical protein
MNADLVQPAHAGVATFVASPASWPSGAVCPLGTPGQSLRAPAVRRRTFLKLRVTALERSRILGRVPPGRDFSEWSRCVLATGSGEDTGAARGDLVRQVAAQGNNLNQVARALNKCALSGEPVHALSVAAELRRIREILEGLL